MGTLSVLWLGAEDKAFLRHHVASLSLYGPLGLFNVTEGMEYPTETSYTTGTVEKLRSVVGNRQLLGFDSLFGRSVRFSCTYWDYLCVSWIFRETDSR